MRKLGDYVVTVINQVSRGVSIVAIVFLLAMMILTVSDVFLRYVFNAPIKGSMELTQYFMIVAGFLGVAWCAVKRGHLKVDFVVNRLPPRYKAIVDTITLILAMTVIPLVGWEGLVKARDTQLDKTVSSFLHIPAFPFYIVMGLGYALMFLVLLTVLAEFIRKVMQK